MSAVARGARRRLVWFAAIWAGSVLALAAVASLLRGAMMLAGMR